MVTRRGKLAGRSPKGACGVSAASTSRRWKRATSAEERCNKLVVALNAKEVTEGRDWPLDKMTKKHVKKRDEALEAIAHRQK